MNAELLLRALPVPAWVVAATWAAARLVAPSLAWPLTAVSALGAAVFVTLRHRKRAWTEAQAAVLLDRLADAGGLVLALRERSGPAWEPALQEKLARARPPRFQWQVPLAAVSTALAFALAAMLLPQPVDARASVNAAAAARLDQLSEESQALAQEQAQAASMEQELARLREELADGRFDATDWEAADTLGEAMSNAAEERAQQLAKAAQEADQLAKQMASGADDEAMSREREELENALAELDGEQGGENAGGEQAGQNGSGEKQGEKGSGEKQAQGQGEKQGQQGENGSGEKQGENGSGEKQGQGQGEKQGQQGKSGSGQKQGENGSGQKQGSAKAGRAPSSAKDLQSLKDALNKRREQLSKAFGQDGKPGQGQGQAGKGRGKGMPGDPADGQGEDGDSDQPGGQGSPAHGKAPPTPLRFGDEAQFQKDRLDFAPLPEGHGDDEPGELWGLQRTSPHVKTGTVAAPGAASDGDVTPGLHDEAVPPRHRDVVRRYFDGARPKGTP